MTSKRRANSNGGVSYTQTSLDGNAKLSTATGVVSYALNDADTDTNALAAGASVSDNFSICVQHGSCGRDCSAVVFSTALTNDNPTVTAGAQSVQLVEAGVGTAGTAATSITLDRAGTRLNAGEVCDGYAVTSIG